MNRPSFFEGVALALLASLLVTAVITVLGIYWISAFWLETLIAFVSFGYIVYLMARSEERQGRVVVSVMWFMVTIVSALILKSIPLFVFTQLISIWLVRSLYYHNGVLVALLDLALMGLSSLVAMWVWVTTHSLFLSSWCFFLTQALFVLIPKRIIKSKNHASSSLSTNAQFEQAHQCAEQALRALMSTQTKL